MGSLQLGLFVFGDVVRACSLLIYVHGLALVQLSLLPSAHFLLPQERDPFADTFRLVQHFLPALHDVVESGDAGTLPLLTLGLTDERRGFHERLSQMGQGGYETHSYYYKTKWVTV